MRVPEARLRYERFAFRRRAFRRLANRRLRSARVRSFLFFDLIGQISYLLGINGYFSQLEFNDIHFFLNCKRIKTPPSRTPALPKFCAVLMAAAILTFFGYNHHARNYFLSA
jgi:hypothetical protein